MSSTQQYSADGTTVITLTLPDSNYSPRDGTILVQHGDLARIHQFTFSHISDLSDIIADALVGLDAVEENPPVISEAPVTPPPARKSTKPAIPAPSEPTVDVPLRKGTKAVSISHIKITGGETDAAAYRQAALLAGRLIDGKLWDGDTPIRFDDVYRIARKMKYLTDGDFSLFTLDDFVQSDASPAEAEPNALL